MLFEGLVFDGLIVIVGTILAFNGYKRGLVASWRGPIAIIAATIAVKYVYVDFATWIMSRLGINPEAAVLIGYLMLWFSLEIILEIVLAMTFKQEAQKAPVMLDRLGGAGYGLLKTAVIIILPIMAVSADIKIPAPPPDKIRQNIEVFGSRDETYLVSGFRNIARALLPIIGGFVVSEKEPSFKPRYKKDRSEKADAPGEDQTEGENDIDRQELEDLLE